MRHGSCSPQTRRAATAPHSAVSELEVVRRHSRDSMNSHVAISSLRTVTLVTVCAMLAGCASTGYIAHAYFYPCSEQSLRGYPTIRPPKHFTGTWTDYTYTGRKLAVCGYRDGTPTGRQVFLDDSGQPYSIYYVGSRRERRRHGDELQRTPPAPITVPPFFPARWLNPTLKPLEYDDEATHHSHNSTHDA